MKKIEIGQRVCVTTNLSDGWGIVGAEFLFGYVDDINTRDPDKETIWYGVELDFEEDSVKHMWFPDRHVTSAEIDWPVQDREESRP